MSKKIDVIGDWSLKKLEIIKKYLKPYSELLTDYNYYHVYIDAFAGAGFHFTRRVGQVVSGSPELALKTEPPFHEYHFIDIDEDKIGLLRPLQQGRKNVYVHHGDSNELLRDKFIPWLKTSSNRRALCILDPYKINYDWEVVKGLGQSRRADLLLNFMISDAMRNAMRSDKRKVDPKDAERMTIAWGDESWQDIRYVVSKQEELFVDAEPNLLIRRGTDALAQAYKSRLERVAGFEFVYDPIPMMNSKNGVIYYLYFASQKQVAVKIVRDIVKKVMAK